MRKPTEEELDAMVRGLTAMDQALRDMSAAFKIAANVLSFAAPKLEALQLNEEQAENFLRHAAAPDRREPIEDATVVPMIARKDPLVYVVLDGPPSPEGAQFVEVENEQGKSIVIRGRRRDDGYWLIGPFKLA